MKELLRNRFPFVEKEDSELTAEEMEIKLIYKHGLMPQKLASDDELINEVKKFADDYVKEIKKATRKK